MQQIYEFNKEDAYRFANFMNAKTRVSGEELQFMLCPYCKGGHGDDKYTFAISLKTGAFNCKRSSCNAVGNMITLKKDFDFPLGRTIDEYFKPRKVFRKLPKRENPIESTDPAVTYMRDVRGISETTTKKYEITTQNNRDDVLVFPFYDEKGQMQFIKYRNTDYKKGGKGSKEWCEKNCKPILFGMNHCNLENRTIIITEGQIDSLSLADCGIENAVSVPTGAKGFTFIPYVWDWMQNFDTIIVFGDYADGHMTLLDEFSRRFRKKTMHVQFEKYKDCKDANEILLKYGKEYLTECVNTAIPLPVMKTIDLSEVPEIDIFSIEKVSTGIKDLDNLLFGGLPFGGVHLITAKAGSGKSTFASQLLIRAKHQGYKCFAYSGELPNSIFKSWMDFQVAGPKCVFEYQNPNTGYVGYNISKTNKHLISEWYKGYIRIYDNSAIDDGDEVFGLLKIIEEVIQQYGMRVILLDNLMTAMILDSTEGSNEYAKQTDFMNKLRLIAVRYNVLIILIAHMRKTNAEESSNDDIAGSSNIGNLAMLTLSYERKKGLEENERIIKLMKNRLFGKLNTKGIRVAYDERSKRIYENEDELYMNYGFDPTDESTYQQEEEWKQYDEDNPFT